MKKSITLFALLAGTSITAFSQVNWNFSTPYPTGNVGSGCTVDSFIRGNNNGSAMPLRASYDPSSGYTGASGGENLCAAAGTGGFDPDGSTYFEVVLLPDNNNSVVLTGISFATRSDITGPQAFAVYSDATNCCIPSGTVNTCTPLTAGVVSNNNTWTYTGILPIAVVGLAGQPVILRIYGFNGAGTATANDPNFSIDDMTFVTTPLPIRLVDFSAAATQGGVALNWETADESNVDKIVVERSGDGTDFRTVTAIPARNEARNLYYYKDVAPAVASYYRLKMLEKTGSYSYSKTVMVQAKAGAVSGVKAFPNPATDNISLSHLGSDAPANVSIYTIDGREVMNTSLSGNASKTLDIKGLAQGSYIIHWQQAGEMGNVTFIKK